MLHEQPGPNDLSRARMRANLRVGSGDAQIDQVLAEIEILRPKQHAIQTQLGDVDQTAVPCQIEP